MRAPTAPQNRDDIRGQVRDVLDDCTLAMQNEIRTGDEYVFLAEDTVAWSEYASYLTAKELRRCFSKARARAEQL